VLDISRSDAAAAEDSDVGKLVEVRRGDLAGLHATHGESGHGTVRLVGKGAVVGINVRNQVINENPLEGVKVETSAAGTARSAHAGSGSLPVACGSRWRNCGSIGGFWFRRAGVADIESIFQNDDERLGFALGDQVVHDQG